VVARDADEADEPGGACVGDRLERAARSEQALEIERIGDGVALEEIEAIGPQPLERALQLLGRLALAALAGLAREEETVAMAGDCGPSRASAAP
jgi:hypothetical protein